MNIEISTDFHGPVFDGIAKHEVSLFRQHVEDTLGDMGVSMIRAYLETQYMYLGHHGGTPAFNPVPHNAGFLQAAIHKIDVNDVVIVTDDPVTYGAWIEGNPALWGTGLKAGVPP